MVKQLNQAEVHNVEDWAWKKQLRFYMNDQKCYVQMVDAELQYTYEYQVWFLHSDFYMSQALPHFIHADCLLNVVFFLSLVMPLRCYFLDNIKR